MNRNGQLVLKTLQNMEQPAPVLKIIRHVAHAINVRPRDVKKTVVDTLRAGARYGYVQLVNNKFYTLPPNICRDDNASSLSSESSDSRGDCALYQRHDGRRRRGGRSRHSGRSRSHSGRNRTRGNSRRSH